MNSATVENTPMTRPMLSPGSRSNPGRPTQSPHPVPRLPLQDSESTGSDVSPNHTTQAGGGRYKRSYPYPSYVDKFECTIKARLEATARRKFPDRPAEQDIWYNTKFKEIQSNYTPRQGTNAGSPTSSPTIEGSITYLAKTPKNTPDADYLQSKVTQLNLADSSEVKQALQQAQDEWDSVCTSDGSDKSSTIRWIHLSANNMEWVRSVMPSAMATCGDNPFPQDTDWNEMAERVFEPEFWDHQRRSNRQNPVFSRTMEPFATYIDVNLEAQSTPPSEGSVNVLAAFMPYLHWESSVAATYMRYVVKDVEQRHVRPGLRMTTNEPRRNDNPSLNGHMSQDEALLRDYLFRESFVHPRRTLDQFYYPLMADTSERDADQVIERYARDGHFDDEAHYDSEPPILMVDQCWVWAIGSGTVVTAFPKTWNGHNQYWDPLDLHTTILKNIRNSRHRHYLRCATEFARFVLRVSAVNILQPSKQIREQQKFLQHFDYAIANLRQRKIDTFRDTQLWWYPDQTPEEKMRTLNAIFHVHKEYEMLKETDDIIEELQMIRELLDDQDSSMRQFEQAQSRFQARAGVDQYNTSKRKESGVGSFMIERPAMTMRRANVDRLIQKAKEVGKAIQNQLGVKHQQAGMIEARFTRRLSEQASRQGVILMVFTAVTIVFLPLSTMAAMFGINAVDLGSGSMHLGTIFAIIFPISVVCVVISLTIPLNRRVRERLFGRPEERYVELFSTNRKKNDGPDDSKGSAYPTPADRPQHRSTTGSRYGSMFLHLEDRRAPVSDNRQTVQSSMSMDGLVPSDWSSQPTMSISRRDYGPAPSRRQGKSRRRNSRFTRMKPELWREQDAPELSLSEGENDDSA